MNNTILVNGIIFFSILIIIFILSTVGGMIIVLIINAMLKLATNNEAIMIPYWVSWLFGVGVSIIAIMFIYNLFNSPY